jgi:predicted amidohydrolase
MQLLNVIDLENRISVDPCKIAICQITCPSNSSEVTENYRFPQELALSQEQKIADCLGQLEENVRFAVFPEFCIPEKTLPKLITFAMEKKIYIIAGLEYDYWLRNHCVVITPSGKCYKNAKLNRSKYDHGEMRNGEYINCFINSGFGDFAVLICYDYTDSYLIQELSGKIDILFVVANNPAVSTFSEKAISDCYSSYCFIVICNNSIYGYSGVYGPLDFFKASGIDERNKKILELPKGEVCEKFELNIKELREAIEKKTGLKLEDGYRFKYIPSNFSRKILSASEPQLEYTLLDWPAPFDQDCIIITGSAAGRAILQLTARSDIFEKIKKLDESFFEKLEPYLPYPPDEKYYMAHCSSIVFLPQLTARLLLSPTGGKIPHMYNDDWVIDGERIHHILKEHNIICISSSDVNIISEKINDELRKDGHVFFPQKRRPYTIFDEFMNRNIEQGIAADKAGIIGLTRNPFNPNKLALLCAGIRGIGTAGAIKFLAENDGEAFRGHRYGLTVFSINLDTPEGFLKGPVKKVLKISDLKLSEHLDIL